MLRIKAGGGTRWLTGLPHGWAGNRAGAASAPDVLECQSQLGERELWHAEKVLGADLCSCSDAPEKVINADVELEMSSAMTERFVDRPQQIPVILIPGCCGKQLLAAVWLMYVIPCHLCTYFRLSVGIDNNLTHRVRCCSEKHLWHCRCTLMHLGKVQSSLVTHQLLSASHLHHYKYIPWLAAGRAVNILHSWEKAAETLWAHNNPNKVISQVRLRLLIINYKCLIASILTL